MGYTTGQKAEDFVGWKSKDGRLEVISIHGKQGRKTTFKVTCAECSKDLELFPEGYFISNKGNLVRGHNPCGCSKGYQYSKLQYLIKIQRVAVEKKFIIQGFIVEFKNGSTKVKCQCPEDGHQWTVRIADIVSAKRGCQKCALRKTAKLNTFSEEKTRNIIDDICKNNNYTFVDFVGKFTSAVRSSFKYICPVHGEQISKYTAFINYNNLCKGCWLDKLKEYRILDEQFVLEKYTKLCNDYKYKPIGFVGNYIGARETRFEYECPKHGIQNVGYVGFVDGKNKCRKCYEDSRKDSAGCFYGYYPDRKEEQDFLYILNFDDKYIKVGRSFDLTTRIVNLRVESKIKNIKILSVYSDKHESIYKLEQKLHKELRKAGFEHEDSKWSTETFSNECKAVLYTMLDSLGYVCVK